MSLDIDHANGHTRTDDAPHVLIGEVITDTLTTPAQNPPSSRTSGARRARLARALRRARRGGIRALRLARAGYGRGHAFVRHETTRAVFLRLVREAAYVLAGFKVMSGWRRDRRTSAPMRRMMKAAAAVGDHDKALEWEARAAAHDQARHDRFMARLMLPVHLARGAAYIAGGMLALGVGLAWHTHQLGEVMAPFNAVAEVVMAIAEFVNATWRPALIASPFIAGAVASWAGHSKGEIPARLAPAGMVADLVVITPSILVTALRDLGLSKLTRAIKEMPDGGAALLGAITSAGCGIEVDVHLPSGTSTDEVQVKRQKLAENVGRHKHELFITIPPRPHTVRLWIADSGALDEPIGPSPLVTDETMKADYRTGRAPWGQSLRGDASTVSLFQRHVLVTGISNQGKTASLRALVLWLALDVRVRLWLADFKGVGDWSMFKAIAEVLIEGPTDQHVMAGTHMVEAGVAEMEKRTDLMRELTAKGWSQDKILADPRFAPLVIVIDEAQKAYGSSAIGEDGRPYGGAKNTSRYFQAVKAIHDQGRAVNVTTAEGVQDPTDANLPVRTREGNHIRASLVVGTESQSKMSLGENAVNAGAAPHELRQGADKGTLVIAGDITAFDAPRGQVYTTIRTHYIGDADAVAIAERAKTRRKGGVETTDGAQTEVPRDELADVAHVLGDQVRMLSEEVLHRLKNHAPGHYGTWTTAALKAALEPHGAEARPYGGRQHISRVRVLEAIAERDETDQEDATGGR